MMANIVEGLFGVTPVQVQQQQQANINAQSAQYATQDPFQRATMGMYQGGAGLAGIGAGMLGMQNPEVVAAQQNQEFASQIDMSTPEGIMAGAKAAQARGDTELALKLTMLARQMREQDVNDQFKMAQAEQMGKPKEPDPLNIERLYSARERAAQAGNMQLVRSIDALIAKETRMVGGGVSSRAIGSGVSKVTPAGVGQPEAITFDLTSAQGSKARKEHADDWSKVKSVEDVAKSSIAKANELLNNDEYISSLFGRGYSGVVTSYMNPNARKKLEEVKNNLKSAGMSIMKNTSDQSLGSMQVNEWPIMEAQIAALDTTMGEEEARQVIQGIIQRYTEWENLNKESYRNKWEQYPQFYKPMQKRGNAGEGDKPAVPAGFTPL